MAAAILQMTYSWYSSNPVLGPTQFAWLHFFPVLLMSSCKTLADDRSGWLYAGGAAVETMAVGVGAEDWECRSADRGASSFQVAGVPLCLLIYSSILP